MNLERYDYVRKRTYVEYYFYSEGPKGRIRKVVRFELRYAYPAPYYNLVFGDWDEEHKEIDDKVITNNGDREKILATVAMIILDFTDVFRKAIIYAEGSNPTRTRLYQISINKFRHEIEEIFKVSGLVDNMLKPFRENINYNAFVFERKDKRGDSLILKEQTETYMTSSQKNNEEKKLVYNDSFIEGPDEVRADDPVVQRKNENAGKAIENCINWEDFVKRHNRI